MLKLDVYNTHMELYPYVKDDYRVIENMYTAIDKHTQKEVPCGYLIENSKLYLPRGTSVSKLEYIVGTEANYIQESDPIEKMSREFKSMYDLRNKLQEDSVKHLTTEGGHQIGLNLGTGIGKTFCVAYASTQLNEKAIIVTPNEGLKSQWINTYHKMFNYRPKNLMNIAGSNIITGIMEDMIEPADVYFVNHATLRNYMTNLNGYALHKFFKKIQVGIKVYDEAHMEFGNILLIDNFSNTNRTWYLTATFDRSDKTQSVCFKRAFSTVITFGESESMQVMEKHVIYHVVNINSRPTPKNRGKVMSFPGLTAASYGRYAFLDDENNTAYNAILNILEKIKDIEGKTIIFVPLIEAVDLVVKKLKLDHPDKSVGAYHSKTSKDEKESAIKKDIIVTTIKSCGTGRDIPGLRSCICLDPVASKVIAQQLIGRLRPYAKGKMTFFFDIVDVAFAPLNWWWKSRFKKIETLVKEVVYLNLDK